jgi:hypothetical protein
MGILTLKLTFSWLSHFAKFELSLTRFSICMLKIKEALKKSPQGVLTSLLRYSFGYLVSLNARHCVPRASLSHPSETFSELPRIALLPNYPLF